MNQSSTRASQSFLEELHTIRNQEMVEIRRACREEIFSKRRKYHHYEEESTTSNEMELV